MGETSLKDIKLSFEAEVFSAPRRLYRETVLIVPFFAARKQQLVRHAEFLNELGFDVVIFEFDTQLFTLPNRLISSQAAQSKSLIQSIGYKHVWADQIEKLLNEIPGRKIIMAFSNPSAGAIEAIARRQAVDVAGLICDGGPTAQYWSSLVKYFTSEVPLPVAPARWLAATVFSPLWSLDAKGSLAQDLASLPEGFPLLSVRGWKDHLIPPKHIDEVFEPHANLDWQKLSLPEGGHLNGLRDFPDEYKPAVTEFLQALGSKENVSAPGPVKN